MFKVILVDDDEDFRGYLHSLIDWRAYGFEICGEAGTGREALEITNSSKPDLAMIDIKMPVMDGLVLSEILKEKFSDINIVLITGHSKFEYAQKAIKIGIEDYLVKPLNKNELIETLLRVKRKLQNLKDERNCKEVNITLKRDRILNALLEFRYSDASDEVVKQHQKELGIDLNKCIFIVSTIEIDNMYEELRSLKNIARCKSLISMITKELIKTDGKHIVFNGPENRIVSLIGFSDSLQLGKFNPEIYQNICIFIKNNFDFTVTIGVGTEVKGFQSIRDSYLEALDALRYKVLSEKGNALLYSKIKSDSMNLGFYPNEVNEKLIRYLRLNDFDGIRKEINNVFDYLNKKKLSIDYTYTIILGLKAVCLSYIIEMGKNIEDVLGDNYDPLQFVTNKTSIENADKMIIKLFEKTVNFFSNNRNDKAKRTVEFVKSYIDENYKDVELNLEKIARNIFLSPDYVRKIFKKETNVTITEYITSLRMQKAKELIDNGDVKFSNVCNEIGYNDASYFSKCFKKHYGLSPRDYENIKK